MNTNVRRYEVELQKDGQLVERLLATLPPAPSQTEHVIIRTDAASVDQAICKALALAVTGVEAEVALIK